MIAKILLMCVFLLELAVGSLWIGCPKLADRFYANGLDSQLKLEEAVRNDVGYSTYLVRFFHNKINVYGTELVNRYIQYWDIRFDVLFFTIVGFFGIICGFWYLLNKPKKSYKTWIILLLVVLLPLIEIFRVGNIYSLRISTILLPYALFSLYGIWQFIKHHRRLGPWLVLTLIILSIWYGLAFQRDIFGLFCYNK